MQISEANAPANGVSKTTRCHSIITMSLRDTFIYVQYVQFRNHDRGPVRVHALQGPSRLWDLEKGRGQSKDDPYYETNALVRDPGLANRDPQRKPSHLSRVAWFAIHRIRICRLGRLQKKCTQITASKRGENGMLFLKQIWRSIIPNHSLSRDEYVQ